MSSPALLDNDKAAVVKYDCPLDVQRNIFLSPGFVNKHTELTGCLRKATLMPASKWVILNSVADFDRQIIAALKTRRHCYFVALIGKRETKDSPKLN